MNRTQQTNKNVSMLAGIIVMAVIAVGVGYLLGSWMINLFSGGGDLNQAAGNNPGSEITITDSGTQVNATTPTVPDANFTPNAQQDGQGLYVVQLGAFNSAANAERLKSELEAKGYPNVVITEGPPYKVQLKASQTSEEANSLKEQVKNDGYVDVFVVHN